MKRKGKGKKKNNLERQFMTFAFSAAGSSISLAVIYTPWVA